MSTEHLLVFPERELADAVADGLDRHVYLVRVLRETLAGEDDTDDAQWLVHVIDERALPPAEEQAERHRLALLAVDNDGWYDDGEDADPAADPDPDDAGSRPAGD